MKNDYIEYLAKCPDTNAHYLKRLLKLFIAMLSIEPKKKPRGWHSHHIVPRSWRLDWDRVKENRILLSPKAHFLIHWLMWKAFPKDWKMVKAFQSMKNFYEQKITSRVYEQLMMEFAVVQSETRLQYFKDNPEAKKEQGEKRSQYYLEHPETIQRISDSLKGNIPWNKGMTGLPGWNDEQRRIEASERMTGDNNPAKRPEVKEKLRKPKTDECRGNMAKSAKSRPKCSCILCHKVISSYQVTNHYIRGHGIKSKDYSQDSKKLCGFLGK